MIPLRDLNPTHSRPVLTWTVIGINALVFVTAWSAGGDQAVSDVADRLGAVAYHFTGAEPESFVVRGADGLPFIIEPIARDPVWPVRAVTHIWLHGGWMHLIGNMWFLHVFGDNVEDRLGRWRYALLYLAAGFAALVAQVVADPAAGVPMIGASGAVAGVLGAYLRLFPHARVLTLVPIGFLLTTFMWPAYVFLGIWMGFQILSATMSHGTVGGGVAWFAHIGGFALGWSIAKALARPEPERVRIEIGRDRFGR